MGETVEKGSEQQQLALPILVVRSYACLLPLFRRHTTNWIQKKENK